MVNFQKFTTKAQQAVQNAQSIAITNENPQVEAVHLLTAMVQDDDSLITSIFKRLGVPLSALRQRLTTEAARFPKVQGADVKISSVLLQVLTEAENLAKTMGDDYTSLDHLLL